MFKGPKPPAQPRSLRSIAEAQNSAQGFENDPAYDAEAGVPTSVAGATQQYRDAAADRPRSYPNTQDNVAKKSPIK